MTPTPATPARTASDTATATTDGVTRHARTSTAHQRRRATSGGGTLPNDKASTQGPNGPPRATKGPRRTSGPADGQKAASGHEKGHHGHGRTPATDRPPARRTDTSGTDRQPAHQPATRTAATTADGHGVGQYWRPPVRQATPIPPRTAAHTGHHWRPVQTIFGAYGVSLAYTQVLVSGKATNIPASRAEVGEVIAAEVGPRSRGASSFEFVRREHCPRST